MSQATKFTVIRTTPFKRSYKKIPKEDEADIDAAITVLCQNPFELPQHFQVESIKNKSLRKEWGKVFRIYPNTNSHRLAYSIKDNILYLLYVSTRENYYRELEKMKEVKRPTVT